MSVGNRLAFTNSQYETKVTHFTKVGPNPEQLLKADPRRWYVRFGPHPDAAIASYITPEPLGPGPFGIGFSALPFDLKFWDCPSVVTGAWMIAGAPGANVAVWESLYVGE